MKVYVEIWRKQLMAWEGEAPDDMTKEKLSEWVYEGDNAPDDEWEVISEMWDREPSTIEIKSKDREPRWIRTKVMSMALLAFSIGDCDVFIEGEYEELQGPLAYEIDILRAEGLTFIIQERM